MPTRPTLTQSPDYPSAREEAIERLQKHGSPTTPGRVKVTACRILIDQYRKHAREEPKGDLTDLVEHIAKHAPVHVHDPYATERAELRRIEQRDAVALWQRLRPMFSPSKARAFELFELEDYTAEETAKSLLDEGLTAEIVRPDLIRQWVHRIREALRALACWKHLQPTLPPVRAISFERYVLLGHAPEEIARALFLAGHTPTQMRPARVHCQVRRVMSALRSFAANRA